MIREIQSDDVPWVLSLGHQRYPSFDPGGGLIALTAAMREPTAIALRTDHAFLVATVVVPVWNPRRPECHILALCCADGAHWEGVQLLRRSRAWAVEQGCLRWWFWSETEHRVGALAKRVGASLGAQRYVIDFVEG